MESLRNKGAYPRKAHPGGCGFETTVGFATTVAAPATPLRGDSLEASVHKRLSFSATFVRQRVFEGSDAMAETTSDVELMLKVKRGDREAFGFLVHRYRKPLINFIYRFTTNPGESEDLAQEVFVRAYQSAAKYEPKAAFSTWLYRIATNVALNYLRDHKPQLSRSLDSDLEGEEGAQRLELRDSRALADERLDGTRERVADSPGPGVTAGESAVGRRVDEVSGAVAQGRW